MGPSVGHSYGVRLVEFNGVGVAGSDAEWK